jgi:hypothetical protein
MNPLISMNPLNVKGMKKHSRYPSFDLPPFRINAFFLTRDTPLLVIADNNLIPATEVFVVIKDVTFYFKELAAVTLFQGRQSDFLPIIELNLALHSTTPLRHP